MHGKWHTAEKDLNTKVTKKKPLRRTRRYLELARWFCLRALRGRILRISMHKIPLKGPAGLLFTIGVLVIFLTELREARWFLALSLPVSVISGIILRLTGRD